MNVIDFIRESANFMVVDRPDVYDYATAVEELSLAIDSLREYDVRPVATIMFTSYVLARLVEDDTEEYLLARKLAGLVLFEEEETCRAFSYDSRVNLPSVLDEFEGDW